MAPLILNRHLEDQHHEGGSVLGRFGAGLAKTYSSSRWASSPCRVRATVCPRNSQAVAQPVYHVRSDIPYRAGGVGAVVPLRQKFIQGQSHLIGVGCFALGHHFGPFEFRSRRCSDANRSELTDAKILFAEATKTQNHD